MTSHLLPGATVFKGGVGYCIWAPTFERVTVDVLRDGKNRLIALEKSPDGYHRGVDPEGHAGDAYGYRINGADKLLPDPASRAQYGDVHDRSLVVDATAYEWQDESWQRPPYRDAVIYELHVGAFTPEGTFHAAIARLPYLHELGVTAIELLPIADFPGNRNWGYDGVLIYAPAKCYGSPDDLRALVDAAHAHGIAVILDVVYNHFGPDGNYVSAFSPYYFHKKHHTPWGNGFNFDAPMNGPVRDFFLRNPVYWMEEFHIDGFRLDATHEIQDDSTPHILAEITDAIHSHGGWVVAEDERNDARVITPTAEGGLGFDGVWADDFHHTARVSITLERTSYFQDFEGSLDQLVTTLQDGWLYCGQSTKRGRMRGTPANHLPPERFVHCISNHDQVGNRAFGERLNHLVEPSAYRALSVLLCLTPYTPMLFMGQEWAASTPFLFFTDHNNDLGRKVTEGRRKEFAAFPEFADPAVRKKIPDPQSPDTLAASRLHWDELSRAKHTGTLALYKECLRYRRLHPAFRPAARDSWTVMACGEAGAVIFREPGAEFLLIFDLVGGHAGSLPDGENWSFLLSSEEERFGGSGPAIHQSGTPLLFRKPEALVFNRPA